MENIKILISAPWYTNNDTFYYGILGQIKKNPTHRWLWVKINVQLSSNIWEQDDFLDETTILSDYPDAVWVVKFSYGQEQLQKIYDLMYGNALPVKSNNVDDIKNNIQSFLENVDKLIPFI